MKQEYFTLIFTHPRLLPCSRPQPPRSSLPALLASRVASWYDVLYMKPKYLTLL